MAGVLTWCPYLVSLLGGLTWTGRAYCALGILGGLFTWRVPYTYFVYLVVVYMDLA